MFADHPSALQLSAADLGDEIVLHLESCESCRRTRDSLLSDDPLAGSAHLEPGAVLADRYEVTGFVAQGGMGSVWRVRHLELGSLHALKVLHRASPADRQRLVREGRAQARDAHPNIVRVTDVIHVDEQPALVMELVDGPSLGDWLESHGPADIDLADRLALQIMAGVEAAHDRGMVHRDLKPLNVLLHTGPDGLVAKVTDFGLVRFASSTLSEPRLTQPGQVMGTPAYMAPEVFLGAGQATVRSDLFALGATLYELLTGQLAFSATSWGEMLAAVQEGRLTPWPDGVPDRMRAAVERAVDPDPERRFTSVAELRAAWLTESPVQVPTPPEAPGPHRMHLIAAYADRSEVHRAAEALRTAGHEVVYELPSRPRADLLPVEVKRSIATAHEVMVFWSAAARRDPAVRAELAYAEQVASEGTLTASQLDRAVLPASLTTRPGQIGGVVWVALVMTGVAFVRAWVSPEATLTTWLWLAAALGLTLGVAGLQWMRRPDRLLGSARVYALGQWFDQASMRDLLQAAEQILDRIFGRRLISRRSVLISAALSVVSVVPIVVVFTMHYVHVTRASGGTWEQAWYFSQAKFMEGLGWGVPLALGNVVLDFVSLVFTRSILTRIVQSTRTRVLVGGLLLDVAVVALCGLGAAYSNRSGVNVMRFISPEPVFDWPSWLTAVTGPVPLAWPGWALGALQWPLTGSLGLERLAVNPLLMLLLVTALAMFTSVVPSLVHGGLLAVGLLNRALGRAPLRALGEALRRAADSPRGPWTVALPVVVSILVALSWVGPHSGHEVDRMVQGRWRHVPMPERFGAPTPALEVLQTEVWQELWVTVWDRAAPIDGDRFSLPRNPSVFRGAQLPVDSVTWCMAARFANLWSRSDDETPFYGLPGDDGLARCELDGAARRPGGTGYRLPTDWEWHQYALAGATTAYWSGDDPADLMAVDWMSVNSGLQPRPVQDVPSPRAHRHPHGLLGIHGNIGEWTEDPFDQSQFGGLGGGLRLVRGGCWFNEAPKAVASRRYGFVPAYGGGGIGFRLVRPSHREEQ